MIKHLDLACRLPWHWHILKQLENRMRHELECSKIASLVTAKLFLGDIANITDNLSQVFRRHIRLLRLNKTTFAPLAEALALLSQPVLLLLRKLGHLRV